MGRMEDHCIRLLSWASRPENWGPQTLGGIAEACGVPVGTLRAILHFHRHHGGRTCYLCSTARNYRYMFKVWPEGSDRVLEAKHLGWTFEAYIYVRELEGDLDTNSP